MSTPYTPLPIVGPLRVVAFLQCLWVKNPARVKPMLDDHERRYPEHGRERMLARLLFYGGHTGNMLNAHLGEDWRKRIVWEEITREIGSHSSAKFPPQYGHIRAVLEKHRPHLVVAFGVPAKEALQVLRLQLGSPLPWELTTAPHPAARGTSVPWALDALRQHLDTLDALYDNNTTTTHDHDHEIQSDNPVPQVPIQD